MIAKIKTNPGIKLMIITAIFFCAACNSTKKLTKDASIVIYRFGDSSVPPKYHRSYTITAAADSINIVVDSYGDVLAEETYELSHLQFDEIIKTIQDSKIKNVAKTDKNDGCTGGTSRSVTVIKNDEAVISGSVYRCGGQSYGDLEGDTDSLSQLLKSFIPDFNKLIE